jgi:hypothetical protein
MAAISEEMAGLSRALRSGIGREKSQRRVVRRPAGPRPVFPAFGTAMQRACWSVAMTCARVDPDHVRRPERT